MKKIGVFAGCFDPVTLGHINIIEKAADIFDSVHVLIGDSMNGKNCLFDAERRLEMLRLSTERFNATPSNLSNVDDKKVVCKIWHGPLFKYCESVGSSHIIKGVRNSADFEYEKLLALQTKVLCPSIDTVLLFPDPAYEHISSSYVRGLIDYSMDISSAVPDEITEIIKNYKY